MTAPAPQRVRKVEDIDRDIVGFLRDRGRCLVQIEEYSRGMAAMRAKYARAGSRIDQLLEERLRLTDAS